MRDNPSAPGKPLSLSSREDEGICNKGDTIDGIRILLAIAQVVTSGWLRMGLVKDTPWQYQESILLSDGITVNSVSVRSCSTEVETLASVTSSLISDQVKRSIVAPVNPDIPSYSTTSLSHRLLTFVTAPRQMRHLRPRCGSQLLLTR